MDKEIKLEVDEIIKKFQQAGKEIVSEAEKAVLKGCLKVERDAKKNCRVDTGRLRASITHRVKKEEGEIVGQVGTNAKYAVYIEFGTGIHAAKGDGRKTPWKWKDEKGRWHYTVGMPPKPFLYPALKSNELDIKYEIAKAIRGLLQND